ncbi:MAG: arylsulfatase [Verrucomicrobia bacterium]|nr:arylsulfatase [Verrucomicrobiota bacterium]
MKRLLSTFALFACFAGLSVSAASKPNIIFLLADDIGYADLSCYGAKHAKTPNLDRLAAQGRRFTDAHSPASTCTPTRRAFLSGRYSWRQQPGSSIAPGDAALSIEPGTSTVASLMKSAGYKTGVVGKWHIGLGPEGGPDWNGEVKPGPLDIGFDYCFIMAATGDRVPTVYIENRRVVNLDPSDPITVSYAKKVGTDPTGAENPELLKLKHTHGHDMTIVNGVGRIGWMTGGRSARWTDEDMGDTFAGKALKFIEDNKSNPFFLYYATHNIHVPRVPNQRFKGTSPVGTRGDSIHELDDAVGKVMAKLDALKLADNTLFIFTSDNGGVMDDGYEDVGSFDYHPNAPLHGYKGSVWEGGHRLPFIARWPGHIKPGSESAALMAHLDMPATFAALVGVKIPAGQCADSINVLPAILGETKTSARTTFVAHNGGTQGPFGLRDGQWKLITGGAGAGGKGKAKAPGKATAKNPATVQLFDLASDLGEEKNLATEQPEKLKEMQELLAKIRGQ